MHAKRINIPRRSLSQQVGSFIGSSPHRLEESLAASIEASKDIEVEQLAKDYQFKDYAEVSAFLNSNAFLILILREAHHKIKNHFGFDTEIALEVFTDPEGDDGQKLFALIFTALPVNEALERLEQLDQEWWLDTTTRAKGRLNIDVEYI
ncbi:hypothetical protein L0244_16350 [bacterium]|nr:hypothetical protein [bacterium]